MEMDAWIAFENDEGASWNGGNWANDTVVRERAPGRSPFFPEGHKAFWLVDDLANSGKYETGWRDPLTRWVKVPKAEIITVIKSLYGNLDHINERLVELEKWVETLPDDKLYTLVRNEF